MARAKSCCWASFAASTAERLAANSTESAWLASRAWRAELRTRERFACRPDRVERIGLGSVAALGSLGSVELDDELVVLREVSCKTRAVAPCALDRPGAKTRVLIRERDELLVAVGGRLDRDFGEYPAGP